MNIPAHYLLIKPLVLRCCFVQVAPETSAAMGTAALPTTKVPSYLQAAQEGRAWYQTWSHLSSLSSDSTLANLVACYADDGRIAVNAELAAGNGIYAAGSVAKFPNPWRSEERRVGKD